MRNRQLAAALWMLGAQVMFGVMNVLTRLGAGDLPWSEVAAARFLLGGLLVVPVALATGARLGTRDHRTTWGRSIFGTISALGVFYALGSPRVAVGDAATLSATGPIFVALLSAPLLGERVGRHVGLAVLVAFTGVALVVQPSFATALPIAVITTLAAVFYALAMIWLRKIGQRESAEAVVLHFSLTAGLTMALITLPVFRLPDRTGALYLLGTGVTGGLAQIAMTRAYALDRAARMSALTYVSVMLTYLFALPIFTEEISVAQLAGAALVIAGGTMVTLQRKPAPA